MLEYFPDIVLDSLTSLINEFMMKIDLWMIWLYFLKLIYDAIFKWLANEFLDIAKSYYLIIGFWYKLLLFFYK